jgi:glutaredoxin
MGTPAASESYEAVGGERVAILYYQTEERNVSVLSVKEECTPVVFVNGKLVGWGDRLTASTINLYKVKSK